jgi:hypothetical protein
MEPPQPSPNGGPGALLHDVAVVLVHAHVGAVHDLHDLAVDAPGHHVQVLPQLITGFGGALGVVDLAVLLAPLAQGLFAHFLGYLVDVALLGSRRPPPPVVATSKSGAISRSFSVS